jgi:RNA polymerase sigma-70 factor, ECF subfamily
LPALSTLRTHFEAVFETEFSYVWSSLKRLGIPERELEDVTHDTFMVIYKHFANYDATRPIKPWLFAFACRVASDYRKLGRNARETATGEVPDAAGSGPLPDTLIAQKQAAALVHEAIQKIAEDRRPVFILAELDEVPMPEIAATLEIPLNTAYSRLRLAREEFKVAVQRLKGGNHVGA